MSLIPINLNGLVFVADILGLIDKQSPGAVLGGPRTAAVIASANTICDALANPEPPAVLQGISPMKFPEGYRQQHPPALQSPEGAAYGRFVIPGGNACGRPLCAIACDGELTDGWEHVSVTIYGKPTSIPSWNEMCLIKDLFWEQDAWVLQFHPPASEYVNNHEGCLHLWRQTKLPVPTPPSVLVGIKNPA